MLHLIRYDSLCIFVYSLIPSGYRKGEGLFGLVTENQKARLVFQDVVDVVVESCVNCLPLGLGRRLVLQKEGGEQSCEAKQKHNRDSMRLHMIASKTADVTSAQVGKKGQPDATNINGWWLCRCGFSGFPLWWIRLQFSNEFPLAKRNWCLSMLGNWLRKTRQRAASWQLFGMPIHRRVGAHTWDGEMSITHIAEIRMVSQWHTWSLIYLSVPWHQTFVEVCGGQVPRTYRFELGHARQRRYGQDLVCFWWSHLYPKESMVSCFSPSLSWCLPCTFLCRFSSPQYWNLNLITCLKTITWSNRIHESL